MLKHKEENYKGWLDRTLVYACGGDDGVLFRKKPVVFRVVNVTIDAFDKIWLTLKPTDKKKADCSEIRIPLDSDCAFDSYKEFKDAADWSAREIMRLGCVLTDAAARGNLLAMGVCFDRDAVLYLVKEAQRYLNIATEDPK